MSEWHTFFAFSSFLSDKQVDGFANRSRLLCSVQAHISYHLMNWINIPRSRLVPETYFDHSILHAFRQRNLYGFLLRSERLDAGVTYQAELLVRAQSGLGRARIGCLSRVDSGSLEYLLAVWAICGHIQDHLSL